MILGFSQVWNLVFGFDNLKAPAAVLAAVAI